MIAEAEAVLCAGMPVRLSAGNIVVLFEVCCLVLKRVHAIWSCVLVEHINNLWQSNHWTIEPLLNSAWPKLRILRMALDGPGVVAALVSQVVVAAMRPFVPPRWQCAHLWLVVFCILPLVTVVEDM